jgi:hypothetical protein
MPPLELEELELDELELDELELELEELDDELLPPPLLLLLLPVLHPTSNNRPIKTKSVLAAARAARPCFVFNTNYPLGLGTLKARH